MRNIAEIAGINKSNTLLYLILYEGAFVNIFMMRLYEPVKFEIHNITYLFLLKEGNLFYLIDLIFVFTILLQYEDCEIA
jgi:hypothetical protein